MPRLWLIVISIVLPQSTVHLAKAGPARISIDSEGVLSIDTRKVFPIGLTLPPPPDAVAPDGRSPFVVLREAGVTFIRTGPTGNHAWNDQTIADEQRIEDAAATCGLHCMPWLRELASIRSGDNTHEALLRQVVARFKDHPAMGIWKGADEPQWGKLPVGPLVDAYRIVREIDPDHPLWIVQAPRGTVETLRPYDPTYDIAGCDIYPVSYPPGIHSLLPNKEISMVGDYTRTMRQVAGAKPVWMTLQIAFSGVTPPGKTLRFPTFEQERFMSYQAIINGARGLVYFGGHVAPAWNQRDARLHWNWTFFDRVLRPVLTEVGENSPIEMAVVAPESKLRIGISQPGGGTATGVEFCARQTPDALYLLVCKREGGDDKGSVHRVAVDCTRPAKWCSSHHAMCMPMQAPSATGLDHSKFTSTALARDSTVAARAHDSCPLATVTAWPPSTTRLSRIFTRTMPPRANAWNPSISVLPSFGPQ
jgi:hypothetical protein